MSKQNVSGWCVGIVIVCALAGSAPAVAQWKPITSTELESLLTASGFDEVARGRIHASNAECLKRFGSALASGGRPFAEAPPSPSRADRAAMREWQIRARAAAQSVEDAMAPIAAAIRAQEGASGEQAGQRALMRLSIARDLLILRGIGTRMMLLAEPCTTMPSQWLEDAGIDRDGITGLDALDDSTLLERVRLAREMRDGLIEAPLRHLDALATQAAPEASLGAPQTNTEVVHILSPEEVAAREARDRLGYERWLHARQNWWDLDARALDALLPQLTGQDQFFLLVHWCTLTHGKDLQGTAALRQVGREILSCPQWMPRADMDEVDAICAQIVAACTAHMKSIGSGLSQQVPGGVGLGGVATIPKELEEALRRATESLGVIAARLRSQLPDPTADLRENRRRLPRFSRGAAMPAVVPASGPSLDAGLQPTMNLDRLRPVYDAAGVGTHFAGILGSYFNDYTEEVAVILRESRELPPLMLDLPTKEGAPPIAMPTREDDPQLPIAVRNARAAERVALRERLRAIDLKRLVDLESSLVPEEGRPFVSWLRDWRALECARESMGRVGADANNFLSTPRHADPVAALFDAAPSMDEWRTLGPDLSATCVRLAAKVKAVLAADALNRVSDFIVNPPAPDLDAESLMARLIERADVARRLNEAEDAFRKEGPAAIARWSDLVSAETALRLNESWLDQQFSGCLDDPTDLSSRMAGIAQLEMSTVTRTAVASLAAKWATQKQEFRVRIVEAAQLAPTSKDAARTIQGIRVERDEMNRRLFREILVNLPEELASRVPALPSQH